MTATTRQPLNTTYDVEAYRPEQGDGVVREKTVFGEDKARQLAAEWVTEGLEVDISRRDYYDHSDVRYTLVATVVPA